MSLDLTGALTEKIGPLPGYAYVAIGVGGIVLFRKFKTGSATGPAPTSMAAPDVPVSPIATANEIAQPSNDQWALAAAQHLGVTSVATPGDISTALSNYLQGYGLSDKQQNIVNQALTSQGFPPQGLIPVVSPDVPSPSAQPSTSPYQNMPAPSSPTIVNNYYGPPAVSAPLQAPPSYVVGDQIVKGNPPPSTNPYSVPAAPYIPPAPVTSPPVSSGPVATYPATRIINRGD